MKSTRYYNQHARALSEQYNAIEAEAVHRSWVAKHLSDKPGLACDIGAGSGRDANWLATNGWDVVAVEPSKKMRQLAEGQSHPNITWLDDALPHLEKLRGLGHRFDFILLSAVWMHVPPGMRERTFRILSELLKPSGVLVITLRHGIDEQENAERGFHNVAADEVLDYAKRRAVALTGRYKEADRSRKHVDWETLVFTVPDWEEGRRDIGIAAKRVVATASSCPLRMPCLMPMAESSTGGGTPEIRSAIGGVDSSIIRKTPIKQA